MPLVAQFVVVEHLVGLDGRLGAAVAGKVLLHIEGVCLVRVGEVLVARVLGDVVFVREEGANAAQLANALAAVHDRYLVLAHQLLAELLVVEAVGLRLPPVLACVEAVDGLLAEQLAHLFERRLLLAAEEQRGVAVADDGVGVVLVDGFELRLRLQDNGGRNLAAADGGNQLLKLRYLPDVGELVEKAADVHREPAAVEVIGLVAEQVE